MKLAAEACFVETILRILPEYFQNTSRILPEYFQNTSRILPEYFQNTSSILPACLLPWVKAFFVGNTQ